VRRVGLGAALFWAATAAHAGDFCGGLDGPAALRELERYAAGRVGRVDPDCFAQSNGAVLPDAVQARVAAACTKAVGLAPGQRTAELDGWCALTVLGGGTARVGERDLVGELLARSWSWDAFAPYPTLAASGDPRVRPFVVAELRKHRETWRKKKLGAAWVKDTWRSHSLAGLAALEKVGTADDLALIAEIAADAPRDARVAAAAERARAAVAARPAGR
jgi:hypothetical protein